MNYYNSIRPEFYAVLDVTQSASSEEIKTAFRKLSLLYHPDKGVLSPEKSHEKFIQLREAYETLIDPIRRADYDRKFSPSPASWENFHPPEPPRWRTRRQGSKVTEPSYDLRLRYALMNLDHLELPLSKLQNAFQHYQQLQASGSQESVRMNFYSPNLKCIISWEESNLNMWKTQVESSINNSLTSVSVEVYSELTRTRQRLEDWITSLTIALNDIISHHYKLERVRKWVSNTDNDALGTELRDCEIQFMVLLENLLSWDINSQYRGPKT